jgi:mediator of RNA polymerase II transcription subunit 5
MVEQPNPDLDVLLQMLQRVTQVPTSSDVQTMHATILSIISQPLSSQLKAVRHWHPGRKDLPSMISTMQSHSDFRRGPFSACPDLHAWRKTPGSLRQVVRTTYQSLITWSVQCALNATQIPPPYHPRQFMIVEREIGAKAFLSIILEELKAQTEHPNGAASVAFDIATAIVCAPTTENSPIDVTWVHSPVAAPPPRHARHLNLRDALRIEYENVTETIQKDHLEGETIVRLHRLVEAQLALSSAPTLDLSTSMPTMVHNLNMTSDVVVADGSQVIDFSQDAGAGLDLTNVADSMALDSTLDSMLANPKLNETDPDDIFGELDFGGMSADMDMDIDGMDMSF